MIEFETKQVGKVKIFTDDIEEEALKQIYEIAESPYAEQHIRIMPDVHAGKGITIGFSGLVKNYINPEHIGCDIGCNITAEFFDKPIPEDKYILFEHKIKKEIPMGFNINDTSIISWKEIMKRFNEVIRKASSKTKGLIPDNEFKSEKDISNWLKKIGIDEGVFYHSIPSVGGGNHFCEYDEGEGKYAITIHCGSRNLGLKVFNYWNKIAKLASPSKDTIKKITKEVREKTKDKKKIKAEIDKAVQAYKNTLHPGYLSDENLKNYLHDMVICQEYARINHDIIHQKIRDIYKKVCGGKSIDMIKTMHNYIDFDSEIPVVRKGAVRSYKGEKFILPFNMKDGLAICEGKSNEDWNYTAPHGAGRKMSRNAAKKSLNAETFANEMKEAGIYTTTANQSTLDEAPEAYKSKEEIIENVKDTCNILYFMKPKINLKAAE